MYPLRQSPLLLVLLFLSLCACSPKSYTVIQNVTVFDGERLWQGVDFVLCDSTIAEIAPSPAGYRKAKTIDGTGQTILPPFINAHVHVREAKNLQEALKSGVFALLDMFSTDARANGLRQFRDSLHYATFYSSNVGATVPGGHGTQFGVEIPTLGDSLSADQFVRERIAQHADYLKISQESSKALLSKGQTEDLIEVSHQAGIIALAHISDLENGLELTEQGIDGLAHVWYRAGSQISEDQLALMQQKGTFVVATLSVILRLIDHARELGVGDQYLSKKEVMEEVGKLWEAGVPILAGTDSPHYGMDYGSQLVEELQLLQQCGLSTQAAVRAATTEIYRYFELEGLGPLAKGALANFWMVEGHPLEDLKDLNNSKRIWKKGKELFREG